MYDAAARVAHCWRQRQRPPASARPRARTARVTKTRPRSAKTCVSWVECARRYRGCTGQQLGAFFGSSSGLTHTAFLLVEAQAGSSSSSETESAPGSSSSSPKSAESSDKAGDVGLPPLPSMLASGPQQWPAANDFAAMGIMVPCRISTQRTLATCARIRSAAFPRKRRPAAMRPHPNTAPQMAPGASLCRTHPYTRLCGNQWRSRLGPRGEGPRPAWSTHIFEVDT